MNIIKLLILKIKYYLLSDKYTDRNLEKLKRE